MTIYNLAQILTKSSFLFQYRRIFQDKRTRQVCFYLLIFLALWGVTQEVLVGFACNPVSIFMPSQASVCIDSLTVWYLTSVMNIVTDFIVFLVPDCETVDAYTGLAGHEDRHRVACEADEDFLGDPP